MDRRAQAQLVQRNETSAVAVFLVGSAPIARRYGNAVARRRGVVCLSSRAFPIPLLHRAIGLGTLVPPDRATLDAVIRPLLRMVGERWAAGEISVAEEHLVSEAVRSRLGHLLGGLSQHPGAGGQASR